MEHPTINKIVDQLKSHHGIVVGAYKNSIPVTAVTRLVVDQAHSLIVELQDDTKEKEEETIELATYSTSQYTALSYVSILRPCGCKRKFILRIHSRIKRR